jgi:ABC-2 type transport system ATP-binding protein
VLLDRLDAAAIDVDGLAVQTADLDDVFLSLTGDHESTTDQHQKASAR